MRSNSRIISTLLLLLLALTLTLSSCELPDIFGWGSTTTTTTVTTTTAPTTKPSTTTTTTTTTTSGGTTDPNKTFDLDDIPEYSPEIAPDGYVVVNNNVPFFKESEIVSEAFERYGELDTYGRCTGAVACLDKSLMPEGDRGSISSIKPSGWQSVNYPETGNQSLYNRSHLIAWSLTGEDANECNLITGTQYMNQHTMQIFENQLLTYIRGNDTHVMYRATPIFVEDNLVASGVLLEAISVEDGGEDIMFCVYVYNVQEGIIIDYATGESEREDQTDAGTTTFDGTIYDFAGFASSSSKNTYLDRTGTDGWTLTWSRLDPQATVGGDVPQVILNGNTSKVGSLTSATISGGVSEIHLNYTLCFADKNGVDFTVSVLKDGEVVATKNIKGACAQNEICELLWVLDEKVEGDFQIKIVNNCPSKASKHADRLSLWNIGWK